MKENQSFLQDRFLFLEEIHGKEAMEFVEAQNAHTFTCLGNTPKYKEYRAKIAAILSDDDRLPGVNCHHGFVYNLWTDSANKRGLWRRASLDDFVAMGGKPQWSVLLDVDALAKDENENWIFESAVHLAKSSSRVLICLSRGGKDATVAREFDLDSGIFVGDGFVLPEGKHRLSWLDCDTLLAAVDDGPESCTEAGYPRFLRLWRRGTAWQDSPVLLTADVHEMSVGSDVYCQGENVRAVLCKLRDFDHAEQYELSGQEVRRINIPLDAFVLAIYGKSFLVHLRSAWRGHAVNSIVEVSTGETENVSLVFAIPVETGFEAAFATSRGIVLKLVENVQSKIVSLQKQNGTWTSTLLPIPAMSCATIFPNDESCELLLAAIESFAHARSMALLSSSGEVRTLLSIPAKFKSLDLRVEQCFANSRDGTRVPYFLVCKKDIRLDGSTPTLLYGYGGFNVSLLPTYNPSLGACWLERGGAYALANIRGGGEFGPDWHRAAQQENRQRAFDDFIAVAEKIVTDGITSPSRLAIWGASNGGLLVGTVMVQRPDLCAAVLCQVPLLDMMRFHKLLAGASWLAEYGHPEEESPAARELARYSPYQGVKAEVRYPKIFLRTSTCDDRVHPGHARKMAAKMISLNNDVFYYENTEGGHAGAADFQQQANVYALDYAFLDEALGLRVQ